MDEKKTAKRYCISAAALLAGGFIITFILVYVLTATGMATVKLSVGEMLGISLAAALLPVGSFTGFTEAGLRLIQKGRLTKGVIAAVCVFFPVTLVLLTVFGILMTIPRTVKSIAILRRG